MDLWDNIFSPFLAPLIVGLIVGVGFFLFSNLLVIRKNRAQLKKLFSRELVFAPINFTQAPAMNREFFDQNTVLLQQMGFSPIGDYTHPHHSKKNYNRALFHPAYYTYAHISQLTERGLWPLITKSMPPTYEFITSFGQGTSLTTSTHSLAGAMIRRPENVVEKAGFATLPEVFNQHVQKLNELIKKGRVPQPVSAGGYFTHFQEWHLREGEFRRQFGYLHPQEVRTIIRRSLKLT